MSLTKSAEMATSCLAILKLASKAMSRSRDSASFWRFCVTRLSKACKEFRRSSRRLWWPCCSASTKLGNLAASSSGQTGSTPKDSASKRILANLSEAIRAFISPLLMPLVAKSRWTKASPALTSWFSRTTMSLMMPPSKCWMTLTLSYGMTLPGAVTTRSTRPIKVHKKMTTKNTNRRRCDARHLGSPRSYKTLSRLIAEFFDMSLMV